jgi:hypothetical protein
LRTEGKGPTTCNMFLVVARPRIQQVSGSLGAVRCPSGCASMEPVVTAEAERKWRGRDGAAV